MVECLFTVQLPAVETLLQVHSEMASAHNAPWRTGPVSQILARIRLQVTAVPGGKGMRMPYLERGKSQVANGASSDGRFLAYL